MRDLEQGAHTEIKHMIHSMCSSTVLKTESIALIAMKSKKKKWVCQKLCHAAYHAFLWIHCCPDRTPIYDASVFFWFTLQWCKNQYEFHYKMSYFKDWVLIFFLGGLIWCAVLNQCWPVAEPQLLVENRFMKKQLTLHSLQFNGTAR